MPLMKPETTMAAGFIRGFIRVAVVPVGVEVVEGIRIWPVALDDNPCP